MAVTIDGANSAYTRILYVAESQWGVTPSISGHKELRKVSLDLNAEYAELQSNEVNQYGWESSWALGSHKTSGNLKSELSFEQYDDFLQAGIKASADWASGTFDGTESFYIQAGAFDYAFTVQVGFTDIEEYFNYTGCMVNTMSFEVNPEALIDVNFALVGKDEVDATAWYNPDSTNVFTGQVMSSFGGDIYLDDELINNNENFKLDINNNVNQKFFNGRENTTPGRQRAGKSMIEGSLTFPFEDKTLWSKLRAGTAIKVTHLFGDTEGNIYAIELPKCQLYGNVGRSISGGDDIDEVFSFRAKRDASLWYAIRIHKIEAA